MFRLSVIVCAKNDSERIAVTLESIVGQTSLANVQVVVVDGASTDDTLTRAEKALAIFGDQVVIDSAGDRGIYDGMNRGLHLSSGDYAYFLNCGDSLRGPDVLQSLVAELPSENDLALVMGRVYHLAGGVQEPYVTTTVPFRFGRFLAGRQNYNHQAMVFNRRAALAAGGFRLQYGPVSDYDLILRLYCLTPAKEIPLVLANYEGGGISTQAPEQIPLIQAGIRADVFRLSGPMAWLNRTYGGLQSRRRKL
jgi:glycosyltransferase involved in cell wall biosynthesis